MSYFVFSLFDCSLRVTLGVALVVFTPKFWKFLLAFPRTPCARYDVKTHLCGSCSHYIFNFHIIKRNATHQGYSVFVHSEMFIRKLVNSYVWNDFIREGTLDHFVLVLGDKIYKRNYFISTWKYRIGH